MDRREVMTLPLAAMFGGVATAGMPGAAFSQAPASFPSVPPVLAQFADYLAQADAIADRLGYTDPRLRPAYHQHALMILSFAYIQVFGTTVERPNFIPYIPFYLPWGAPNPDDNYRIAPVVEGGTYRLFGRKGTGPIAKVSLRNRAPYLGQTVGRTIKEIDLNTATVDGDGRFSILVSAKRPDGYTGQWEEMPTGIRSMMFRSRLNGPEDRDAECLIERLDSTPAPAFPDAEQVAARMTAMKTYASAHLEFLLTYLNRARARGSDKGFVFDEQTEYGGLLQQRYLMYSFGLRPDEAILIETEVPETIAYWSVQLHDAHFSAIDYVNRQSSLNGSDVRIDKDGKARFVVAASDPGSANWLDTGGWPSAGILWRWNNANRYPVPATRVVKLAEVRRLLPAGHPMLTPAERGQSLSKRAAYYQTRGR